MNISHLNQIAKFILFSCILLSYNGCSSELPGSRADISDEVVAKGQLDRCKANLRDLATALEVYSGTNSGEYPPLEPGLNALVPDHLEELPKCPTGGEVVTYRYYRNDHETNVAKLKAYYYIECHGGNHINAGIEGNFPAFSAILQDITDQADLEDSIRKYKEQQAKENEKPEESEEADHTNRQF